MKHLKLTMKKILTGASAQTDIIDIPRTDLKAKFALFTDCLTGSDISNKTLHCKQDAAQKETRPFRL
jgi:hypothetical protein